MFYVIIVTFQVSATSGPLNVFIFSAQLIASTMNENKLVFTTYSSQSWFHIVLQALITFYGIWNLDWVNVDGEGEGPMKCFQPTVFVYLITDTVYQGGSCSLSVTCVEVFVTG